jgi:putative acetyltransferase
MRSSWDAGRSHWHGLKIALSDAAGVRLIDDDTAELKRMFVVPEFRRQGVAGAVLRFLESEALDLGASRVVLETVTTPPDAVALYQAAGYEEIPRFGPYVDSPISYCMGKSLKPS